MNHKATEDAKKKPVAGRSSIFMPFLKWVGVIVGIFAFLVFAYFGTLYLWLNQGHVRSSLPPELQATAEALLENPQIDPPLDDSQFYVDIMYIDRANQEICFRIASGSPRNYELYDNGEIQIDANYTEILINGDLAGRAFSGGLEPYRVMNGYTSACIRGLLDDGLHFVELRAIDSPFGRPNYVKRWAIQVDCRYSGCVVNSAPSSSEFGRARSAWYISPIGEELQPSAEQLLETPNSYDDVELSLTDISVPTVSAQELCFSFQNIAESDGTLTLNGIPLDMYTFYFDDGQLCRDYRFPLGLTLIELDLDALDQVYRWAIEIE